MFSPDGVHPGRDLARRAAVADQVPGEVAGAPGQRQPAGLQGPLEHGGIAEAGSSSGPRRRSAAGAANCGLLLDLRVGAGVARSAHRPSTTRSRTARGSASTRRSRPGRVGESLVAWPLGAYEARPPRRSDHRGRARLPGLGGRSGRRAASDPVGPDAERSTGAGQGREQRERVDPAEQIRLPEPSAPDGPEGAQLFAYGFVDHVPAGSRWSPWLGSRDPPWSRSPASGR